MTDDDIIRLAEAMGWRRIEFTSAFGSRWYWAAPAQELHDTLPDPRTDANADYAVLEWMRKPALSDDCSDIEWKRWREFVTEMHSVGTLDRPGIYSGQTIYTIGDYARAALKVIDQ